MESIQDDLFLPVDAALQKICIRVDETLHKQRQQMEACKRKNELDSKLATELRLHEGLSKRAAGAGARRDELRRVCSRLERLAIAATDRARLQQAEEAYRVAKELTGVRWDFCAPDHVAKGYAKSESRKLLEPFEVRVPGDAKEAEEALWAAAGAVALHDWTHLLKI